MAAHKNLSLELQDVINQLRRSKLFDHNHSPLKGAEKQVLFKVAKINNGQPVSPSEIAFKLSVSMSAITHQINSLEKQGLIGRLQENKDKRVVELILTPKGLREVKKLEKEFSKKLKILTDYLGEKDTRDLIRVIKKISILSGNLSENKNA
jgi:DNA-binding MarR family transcriptional regulator